MEGFGISRASYVECQALKNGPDTRFGDPTIRLGGSKGNSELTYEEPATHLAEGRGGWLGGALVLGGHGIGFWFIGVLV